MTSSKQTQTEKRSEQGSRQTFFDPRSGKEEEILRQYQNLGDNQTAFLQNLMRGETSPFALGQKDQQSLDDAYAGAFSRFGQEGKDYADYLATTRGLNKSDTPVSAQAMDRYGMGMADLLSQKANAGLNLGLQGTSMKLMGAQALPAGLGAAFSPMFSERMARGRTYTTGNSTGTVTNVNTPSLMTSIGNGMQLGTQALALGAGIGSMGMGMPGMGAGLGMGSGAAANKWFM